MIATTDIQTMRNELKQKSENLFNALIDSTSQEEFEDLRSAYIETVKQLEALDDTIPKRN